MGMVTEVLPISDLRHRQNEILASLQKGPVILTQRGRGAAVLLSLDEWNMLLERLEELEDAADAVEARRHAEPGIDFDDYLAGRGKRVSAAAE